MGVDIQTGKRKLSVLSTFRKKTNVSIYNSDHAQFSRYLEHILNSSLAWHTKRWRHYWQKRCHCSNHNLQSWKWQGNLCVIVICHQWIFVLLYLFVCRFLKSIWISIKAPFLHQLLALPRKRYHRDVIILAFFFFQGLNYETLEYQSFSFISTRHLSKLQRISRNASTT